MAKPLKFPTGEAPKAVANSVVYPKRITIDTEKGIRTSGDVTFLDVLNLCLNAIVANAFRVVDFTVTNEAKEHTDKTEEELADYMVSVRKNVVSHLYDKMNESFTSTLATFAPDLHQHPGLTELAIMKAEDELIEEYFASLPPDTLESAKEEAQKVFEQSRRALLQKIADNKAAAEQFQALTPEQDAALHVLVDEEATEEAKEQAKAYIAANPLPCMTPAVEPGETVEHFERTPSKEELDDCGAICSQCENETCKKSPPIGKLLNGLE